MSNRQCVDDNGGLPYMCLKPGEPCVSLISQDCTEVIGDYASDNAPILFGHMMALSGGFKFTSAHHKASASLALKEIAKAESGLPGGPNGTRRPLVMIGCDEEKDPKRAATHLVDTLGVSSIIGCINAENIVDIANNVTVPKGVLMIGTSASPLIVNIADQGLVWSTVSDLTESVNAYPTVIRDIEAKIRAERGLAPTDDVKVALLVSDRLDEKAKESRLLGNPDFLFNGDKSWQQNEATDKFRAIGYPDPTSADSVDYSIPIAAVLDFKPDILVAMTGPELDQELAPQIEDNWPEGQPKPNWILPFKSPAVLTIFSQPEERRMRVRGINYKQPDASRYAQWAIRFKGELQGTAPGPWVEARYDAVYALAYAYVATAGIARPTGADLASGLAKLNPPGIPIVVGQDGVSDAVNVLYAKGDIDLEGVYSDLNFDVTTGWPSNDAEVFCINSSLEWEWANQVWLHTDEAMEGTFACP